MSNSRDWVFDLGHPGVLIPSGIHIGVPLDYLTRVIPLPAPDWEALRNVEHVTVSVCNPMPDTPCPITQVDEVPADEASAYLQSHRETRIIRLQDVTMYGDLLAQVAKWLQICGYDGIIVPVRGGVKPFTQLNVLTEMRFEPCLLPFTQGANRLNEEQVRDYLKNYLERRAGNSPLKLSVVDTADSGHSALCLAEICRSLRRDWRGSGAWAIDFILFFEFQDGSKRYPPKSFHIPKLSSSKLVFRVFACGTPSLLVEDWDEALGIKTVWRDGRTPEFVLVPSKGRLVIQDYDGILRQYEAERLDLFTDQILGQEASDAVITDQSLRFHHDVWQKYKTPDGNGGHARGSRAEGECSANK